MINGSFGHCSGMAKRICRQTCRTTPGKSELRHHGPGPDWEGPHGENWKDSCHAPRPVSVEEHPRLFITQQEIDDLNEAARSNPALKLLITNEIITPTRMTALAITKQGHPAGTRTRPTPYAKRGLFYRRFVARAAKRS